MTLNVQKSREIDGRNSPHSLLLKSSFRYLGCAKVCRGTATLIGISCPARLTTTRTDLKTSYDCWWNCLRCGSAHAVVMQDRTSRFWVSFLALSYSMTAGLVASPPAITCHLNKSTRLFQGSTHENATYIKKVIAGIRESAHPRSKRVLYSIYIR